MIPLLAQTSKANDNNVIPLHWTFKDLPVTGSSQGVCVQAGLSNGRSLMFDGRTRQTWIFDFLTKDVNGWTLIDTKSVAPSPQRQAFAMASLSGGDKVILFGGASLTGAQNFNDTWIFDQSKNDWIQLIVASSPSLRYAHAMASSGDGGNVVLFGGSDSDSNNLNDTWIFDQLTNKWMQIDTKSSSPPGCFFHAMTSLGDSGRILLFGGTDGVNFFKDTWIFEPSLNKWTKIATTM